jgi:hypothetical protein
VLALAAAFLGCWLALAFKLPVNDHALLAIAGVSAIFLYFVRCERCHSSIYYRAGGTRTLFHIRSLSILWAKQCPSCKLERV